MPVLTPQLIFMIVGIAFIVVSVILLVLALVYYVRQDIRGVMDDLSGKSRQGRGSGRSRRTSTRRSRTPVARTPMPSQAPEVEVREAPGAVVTPGEDELDTVLDTKLRKIPGTGPAVNSDMHDVNDDMPTLVTSMADYHSGNVAESHLEDADEPTYVDHGGEDDSPTMVDSAAVVSPAPFVVTRSMVAIHSNEIIAAG